MSTTLGPVHIAARERGVVAVALRSDRASVVAELERRFGVAPRWLDEPGDPAEVPDRRAVAILREAVRALTAFDAGDAGPALALALDLEDRPAWDRAVLGAVRAIPRGETRSYGEIARAIGHTGAARAVGGAVGRNPIALVIPCHRVIAGDGTLGGYGGGWWGERDRLLDLKATLLAREGRVVPRP